MRGAICAQPGCPRYIQHGTHCDLHQRLNAAGRGYDARWQRTRAAFLTQHPTCQCDDCLRLPAHARPQADTVDHIDGLGPGGPHGHDQANLRAMTHAHHSRRTARDQPAGWVDERDRAARSPGVTR